MMGNPRTGERAGTRSFCAGVMPSTCRTRQGAENRPYHADVYGPTSRGNALGIQQRFTAFSTLQPMAQCASALAVARLRAHRRSHLSTSSTPPRSMGMASATNQQGTMQAALAALLDRIGPAIVLTHSQSGPYGWLIADARPSLVKGLVPGRAVGPSAYQRDLPWPARTGFKTGRLQFPWGITACPASPIHCGHRLLGTRAREAGGGRQPQRGQMLAPGEPVRTLPNLQAIPILIVTSEAGYHSSYDNCTSEYLTQAGVPEHARVPWDVGIHGNGHMMMLEKNNLRYCCLHGEVDQRPCGGSLARQARRGKGPRRAPCRLSRGPHRLRRYDPSCLLMRDAVHCSVSESTTEGVRT